MCEAMCVCVCVHGTEVEGAGSREAFVWEERFTLWSPEAHKLKYTLTKITVH